MIHFDSGYGTPMELCIINFIRAYSWYILKIAAAICLPPKRFTAPLRLTVPRLPALYKPFGRGTSLSVWPPFLNVERQLTKFGHSHGS